LRRVPNVDGAAAQRVGRDPANPDEQAGPNDIDEPLRKRQAGRHLDPCRAPVRQGLARQRWMRGDGVPEDDPTLGAHFIEHTVDDGAGWFFPWSGAPARSSVRITPAQQVELAGEGDARPAHSLVAGGLADRKQVGLTAFREIVAQVGEPNRGRLGHIVRTDLAELVEGRANRCLRQVREQRVERGYLVRIAQ